MADSGDSELGIAPAPTPRGLRTLLSDFSAVLGGRIASVALSLVTVAVTTHLLGPTGYGQLAYVTIVATLIFVGGSTWTSSGVLRYGREVLDSGGAMQVVTTERLVITAPTVLVAAGIAVGARAVGWVPASLTWPLTGLAVAYGFLLVLSDHVVYALQAVDRMRASASATVLRQVVALAIIGAGVAAGVDFSATEVVVVLILSWLLMTAVAATPIWHTAIWPPMQSRATRQRMLRFGIPLLAFTVSQYVISTIDLLVLGIYRSAAQVGVYAVAYQAYSALQSVGAAAATVLTPLFVSLQGAGRSAAISAFVRRAIPQLTFVAGTIFGAVAPFTTLLVTIVFGQSFEQAAQPLIILLVPATLFLTASLQAPLILLHEETRGVGRINVVAAVANVVGDFILIGPAGLGGNGAAIATTGAMVAIVVGYSRIVGRRAVAASAARQTLLLTPMLVGVVLGLRAGSDWLAATTSTLVVLLLALALVATGAVFQSEDEEYLRRLRVPARLRRLLVRNV